MKITAHRAVRLVWLLVVDAVIVNVAFVLAYLIRFEFRFTADNMELYFGIYSNSFYIWTFLFLVFFALFGIYRSMWRYTSIDEIVRIFGAVCGASLVSYGLSLIQPLFERRFPISIVIIAGAWIMLISCGIRVIYLRLGRMRRHARDADSTYINLLIVGAGDAGSALIREIQQIVRTRYNIVGVVDDDIKKHRHFLRGVRVLGATQHIAQIVEQYHVDEIIIAIPSASFEEMSRILEQCPHAQCRLRVMHRIYDTSETSLFSNIREVRIEDLLGREEVALDGPNSEEFIKNRVVLVSGGGGSIGSELCRQIMKYQPRQLVILDFYENNVYELMNELNLLYKRPDAVRVCIGSVQDRDRLYEIMREYEPDVVFHAAAYKHVPLMEDSPALAVQNNVFGTYNLAQISNEVGVRRFVLISTDKAVNPTNVMGATKRVAELIIQSMNANSDTAYTAVRFGNVLGSNGSVVPLFKKQIESGGPVTITHPDITRYFMTIPEAASLVVQAGAMAQGGEVFILDMGEPIRIVDIARNLIYLSGLVPDQDIKIEYVGLRPGEKLYEELITGEEGVMKSENNKIFVTHGAHVTTQDGLDILSQLNECLRTGGDVREALMKIVPTYHPEDNNTDDVAGVS